MTSNRWTTLILALMTSCAVLPPAQIDPRQARGASRVIRRAPDGQGQLSRLEHEDLLVTRGTPRNQGLQYGHVMRAELLARAARRSTWIAWSRERATEKSFRSLPSREREEIEGIAAATGLSTGSLWLDQHIGTDDDAWTAAVTFDHREGSGHRWQGGLLAARVEAPLPIWHLRSPGGLMLEEPGGFARSLLTLDRPGGALMAGTGSASSPRISKSPPSLDLDPDAPGIVKQTASRLESALERSDGTWDRSLGWSILATASHAVSGSISWMDTIRNDHRLPRGAWLWDPANRTLDMAVGRESPGGAAAFRSVPLARLWRGGRITATPGTASALRNVTKAGKRRRLK